MVGWLSSLASVGMAIGPPLVYADQAYSIVKKRDSTGFSHHSLGQHNTMFLLVGEPFRLALLVQSVLMILAQLALLYICIRFRSRLSPESLGASTRPFAFWQWSTYSQYIEFLAGFILCQAILFLILGRSDLFISALGFVALGLESTLPIPQLISNYKQRSLYGFRMSTLIGWFGGDSFKTVYFFLQESPLQFKVCAIFQLSIDCAIVLQRVWYGNAAPATGLMEDEDVEQALALDEE
uniref:FimK n=1 Tax=Ganoderma boninense TaxID=34458 RepID=A0A5K1JSR9_9APHY|nr:FimK [Ganoderma boninense]